MFSSGAVIRNVGGNQLKVMDIDRIQSFGLLQTNSLIDRFTRLHKAGARMQYNPSLSTIKLFVYSFILIMKRWIQMLLLHLSLI